MPTRPAPGAPPPMTFDAPAPIADLVLAVVTPMFGGGAETGQTDPELPIRPSSIRGHLRFWWRACNAPDGAYHSTADLFDTEANLWGAMPDAGLAGGPAAINVRIDPLQGNLQTFEFMHGRWESNPHANVPREIGYALFPFNGMGDSPSVPGHVGVRFQLRLTLADGVGRIPGMPTAAECQRAAEQALWAWITFGGVGARTRRGCGTLYCEKALVPGDEPGAPSLDATDLFRPDGVLASWIEESANAYVEHGTAANRVPTLSAGCYLLKPGNALPMLMAWSNALAPMQLFRQGRDTGRKRTGARPNAPGESYWPEVGGCGPCSASRPAGIGVLRPRAEAISRRPTSACLWSSPRWAILRHSWRPTRTA